MTAEELVASRWDALTPETRRKLVLTDRSMRDPRWAALVETFATSPFAALSPLQRDAVATFLAAPGVLPTEREILSHYRKAGRRGRRS